MDLYDLLLFLHVSGVIVWVGAGVTFQVVSERAIGGRDLEKIRAITVVSDTLGKAYFGVLTLVVLLSGIALVFRGEWGFDHVFILGGLLGIVASGAIGGVGIGPTATRLGERLTSATSMDEEIEKDMRRLRNFGRLDLAIMVTVVFLMTVKPGSS